LTMENGRLTDLQFLDANIMDDWQNKPYDAPPAPLEQFMGSELFLFRDGNFWPDFPTSAENLIALYSYGQDVPPMDGVIAIDQQFLLLLVEPMGNIPLSNSDETINSGNVEAVLRDAWAGGESDEWGEFGTVRKGFLGYFAAAIQKKLFNDFGTIDPITLALNMETAAREKDLQIYMRDPQAATALAGIGWDGRLSAPGQDALMVVETNVGFNKTNLLTDREMVYSVDLRDADAPTAALTLTYTNTGDPETAVCRQGSSADKYTQGYFALANDCYFTYLRVYAPEGAILTDSSRHIVPANILLSQEQWDNHANQEQWDNHANSFNEQSGFTTFSNFLSVPQGESVESQFAYDLPTAVTTIDGNTHQYQLALYKQAGLHAEPVQIHLQIPDGAELLHTSIPSSQYDDGNIQFDLLLNTDTIITITYRE